MNAGLDNLFSEATRTAVVVIIPSLGVALASLAMAALQGTLGIQEGSGQYAVRLLALLAVLTLCGRYFADAVMSLLTLGLGPT